MKLCVIGSGYVGLVTGTCLADMGHHVVCQDIDEEKISRLKQGEIPIYEPGLRELVAANQRVGQLHFTTALEDALEGADVCFIAVGTPADEDGSADVGRVIDVARAVGTKAASDMLVVVKSTVPVGTCDRVREAIREASAAAGKSLTIDVVSNPEFLKEGMAVQDFMRPDRIVVGTESDEAAETMQRVYQAFVRNGHPLLVMDTRSAEITKYASNAMLATRISLMNEIANICSRAGADVAHVRRGVGSDGRIGQSFLYPGIGYGGSCFPKDVAALTQTAKACGLEPHLLQAVETVNRAQKRWLVEQVLDLFGSDLTGKRFALWGLAFKPKTDDIREAPALLTVEELTERGATIMAYDPEAQDNAAGVLADNARFVPAAGPYEAAEGAHALLLATEWGLFRNPDFSRLKETMAEPIVLDGRNQYDPQRVLAQGFTYRCVGRPSA